MIATIAIMDEFASRLAAITTTNGYNTDIGTSVIRGMFTVDEDVNLPIVSLMMLPRTAEEVSQSRDRIKVSAQIQIEAHMNYTTAPETTAAHMLADISRAVEIEPYDFGGLLSYNGFSWAGDEIIYPADVSNVVSVIVLYDIPHVRYTGDPEKPSTI